VDVLREETTDAELTRMIERRTRKGDVDPDELEASYVQSVRAYTARRREEMRAARVEYHRGQAVRLRVALEALIARHEEQAERYRNQPEGATWPGPR
jgi:hypothetical protein